MENGLVGDKLLSKNVKMNNRERLMEIAIEEAKLAVTQKDGTPFGAVICRKDRQIIATAHNETIKENDPTAHAELIAIRRACAKLKCTNLDDCILYVSAEPCSMCVSGAVWSGIKMIYYGASLDDYSSLYHQENRVRSSVLLNSSDFRTSFMHQLMRKEACEVLNDAVRH